MPSPLPLVMERPQKEGDGTVGQEMKAQRKTSVIHRDVPGRRQWGPGKRK